MYTTSSINSFRVFSRTTLLCEIFALQEVPKTSGSEKSNLVSCMLFILVFLALGLLYIVIRTRGEA